MALKYNDTSINSVEYNNTNINKIMYNNSVLWCRPYTVTVSTDSGVSDVTVKRTSTDEPTSYTGNIASINTSTAKIYHGDTLSVTASPKLGYVINSYNPTYSVDGNISINITSYVGQFEYTYAINPNNTHLDFSAASDVSTLIKNSTKLIGISGNFKYYSTARILITYTCTGTSTCSFTVNSKTSSNIVIQCKAVGTVIINRISVYASIDSSSGSSGT